jgi:hypothetical protein
VASPRPARRGFGHSWAANGLVPRLALQAGGQLPAKRCSAAHWTMAQCGLPFVRGELVLVPSRESPVEVPLTVASKVQLPETAVISPSVQVSSAGAGRREGSCGTQSIRGLVRADPRIAKPAKKLRLPVDEVIDISIAISRDISEKAFRSQLSVFKGVLHV